MTTFSAIARHGGRWLPVIGVSALAGTLSTLALPIVLGKAVDAIVMGGAGGTWLVLSASLIAVGVLVDLVDAFAGVACVASTTAWLRNRLIRHLLAAGPGRRFDTGDLVTRVSGNAVDAAQAGPALVTVWMAVLPPAGSLVLLTVIDFWLAVAFVAGLTLVALVLWVFTRRTAQVITSYQQVQGRIAARLEESLAGARTIAAAGTLHDEKRRVLRELPTLHDQGIRSWQVLARSVAQAGIVGPLVTVAVLGAGGVALLNGRITPGDLFAALQYAILGAGLGGMTSVFSRLARARAGANRAAEIFDTKPMSYGRRALPDGPGRIEFRHVTVHKGESTPLRDVSLTLPGGAAVAVVGGSGAGKSVLAAVAARLEDPSAGEILLDGVSLAELGHASVRNAVGCAFERPTLVGGTIADAVGMGHDLDTVRSAAQATHAHEFVSRLPRGYNTPLADAPMSGGEAQRLGLARAWHAKRLLVLDDATSSLDMVTEMQIGQTLTTDHGRRTRLIITHRVATAARADLVVWMDSGKVRAVGPHAVLWEDPAYQALFGASA
ncbi:ATP-binding cassette subfamily B protein [Kibdelosporangium banguiense]|uniref:ATP-binding cassette subfamily B protein n=1 Tax=Kibdelosporangium banguiense TaxID=1365924 RepID=A0ABS4TIP0_9PSEU|nr:ABC transporter ATP-binding protein [Kibdelosporangium banguiense]MBP2324287.1 ATP-binding cassette subfamily B protein [Kibdelosporangium banguiense]